MSKRKLIAATVFMSLLAPLTTRADGLDPKQVPAEARWVLHVDVDAARDTKSFDLLQQNVLSSAAAQAKIQQIDTITGMKIPDDVRDFTLYGKDADDEAGVVLIHAKIDPQKTESFLEMADQFASNPYGNYAVFTWLDKDKNQTMFAAFHDPSNLIVGRNEANIDKALDAMDGKTATLKADSPLVAGAAPQLLLYVAATDISQLHRASAHPNPIVESIQSGWISIAEKDDTVNLRAQLVGTSPEKTTSIRTSLEGLKAMLSLAAGGEDADPVAKAVVAASKTFATTQKDNAVLVDWPVPVDQISGIVKAIVDKHAANH